MARGIIQLYRWEFPETWHPLEIERDCIRRGGTWKRKDGKTAGEGLFFHFKKFIEICWPEFVQHRWFNKVLENYLAHEWMGLTGPKNSGKTADMAIILLSDYYCFPSK